MRIVEDANLSSRVDALNGRIDKMQRGVDAGTAVAVAMGGAVVSRHVAFNAGVTIGFNRGGQTAGRAGFTVGW